MTRSAPPEQRHRAAISRCWRSRVPWQNPSAATSLADRIYILNNGHIIEKLTAQSLRGQLGML
ncbi:MAG TPA: hypothetical protein VFQ82_10450, partial [Stellaceae bacterium]|nr:hypothetical protein [Stellaceae bacterium]